MRGARASQDGTPRHNKRKKVITIKTLSNDEKTVLSRNCARSIGQLHKR